MGAKQSRASRVGVQSPTARAIEEAETTPSGRASPSPPSEASDDSALPAGLQCAVCLQLIHEPVLWPPPEGSESCGHAFCLHCTLACVSRANACCPLCRAPAAPDAATSDLQVDSALQERIIQEAAAQHITRVDAQRVEARLRTTLPDIMLYHLDKRYELTSGYVLDLVLKEPVHLWLLVKMLVTGVRKLGLLFPATAGGDQNGRIASVINLPFQPLTMSLDAAIGRVGLERYRKGHCMLRLKVSGDFFRAMYIEHAAPTPAEEPAWQMIARGRTNAQMDPIAGVRLGITKAVITKGEAALPAAVAAALGRQYREPPSEPSSGSATPSRDENSSRSSRTSAPRFGPYVRARSTRARARAHPPTNLSRICTFHARRFMRGTGRCDRRRPTHARVS